MQGSYIPADVRSNDKNAKLHATENAGKTKSAPGARVYLVCRAMPPLLLEAPCLRLMRANSTEPCAKGVFPCRIVPCESDCGRLLWPTPRQLWRALLPHRWLLFVGDSDTRGLVLGLLQMLAAAGHGSEFARQHRPLWLGSADNSTNPQASRICHLDWGFGPDGVVLSSRAVNCLELNSNRRDFGPVQQNQSQYVVFGDDYELESQAATAPSLRVTFITTNAVSQMIDGLRVLSERLDRLGRDVSQRPGLLYVNSGAWQSTVRPPSQNVASALERFGDGYMRPAAPLFWGTGVPERPNIDSELVPLLSERWRVLNRSSSLALAANRHSASLVRLSSGHQPHLINNIDALRLATAPQRPDQRHSPDEVINGAHHRCGGQHWFVGNECAGHGRVVASRTLSKKHIEAYQHWCDMEATSTSSREIDGACHDRCRGRAFDSS